MTHTPRRRLPAHQCTTLIGYAGVPSVCPEGRGRGRADRHPDLGGSISHLSLMMARKVRMVYSSQPAPHAIQEMRKHISVNRLVNIVIVPEAASDYEGEATFGLTDVAYGSAITEGQTGWPTIAVKVTTLDALARAHEWPDLITIEMNSWEFGSRFP